MGFYILPLSLNVDGIFISCSITKYYMWLGGFPYLEKMERKLVLTYLRLYNLYKHKIKHKVSFHQWTKEYNQLSNTAISAYVSMLNTYLNTQFWAIRRNYKILFVCVYFLNTVVLIRDQTQIHYLAVVFIFVMIQKLLIYVLKDLKIWHKFQH